MASINENHLSKKNIVFVLNEYNGHGGTQKVSSVLANAFASDGHDVSVLSINRFDDDFCYFDKRIPITVLHENGYRAGEKISLMQVAKKKEFRKVGKELKRRRQARIHSKKVDHFFDRFQEEEVFVIVVQVWGMQWLNNLYYKKNIKLIGQSHESYQAAKNTHRFKKILSYYRMVDKFLLLSQKDADLFQKEGFEDAGYLLNPAPFSTNNEPAELYEHKRIVSVGRLIPDKGFQDLIQAFHLVHQKFPEWTLSIYGDGPSFQELKQLIHRLHLEKKVFLEGESNDIQQALNDSSFFVLPSYAEGLPMVLIEAQSCGLPCISTDCAPGIREIITEYENGLISRAKDVDKLSMHLETLMSQKDTFVSYSAQALQDRERFSLPHIKRAWYSLFEELED